MANNPSAAKRARQNVKRRERNKGNRSFVKTVAQNTLEKILKDPKNALAAISEAASVLAKTAQKGSIPKGRAARKLSRLHKARNKALGL
jgi:small subunit ribosomal protein S20